MKVLILGLNYAPEPLGVGKYSGELSRWLVQRGHEVTVVTGMPYYPAWRVAPGFRAWRYQWQRDGGVRVLRCPILVRPGEGAIGRILILVSFALSSLLPCLWLGLVRRPDLVIAVEPTVAGAPNALLAARLVGARACLHVQDLEIEAAFQLGLLGHRGLARWLRGGYRWLLRRFDLVSTVSRRMYAHLNDCGIPRSRLCLCPNGVDTARIRPLAAASGLRGAFGLAPDDVVVLYAGNIGAKQGVEMLAEVAERLAAVPRIRVVICGDGVARARVERATAHLANVLLLPVQPAERLNELLNLADIHVLPQRREVASFAFPSKLGGMLASGRPVVVQARRGELARTVHGCGVVVRPGDARAMAAEIMSLARDPARRARLGEAGRAFALAHLDRDQVAAAYEQRLLAMVERRPHRVPAAPSVSRAG